MKDKISQLRKFIYDQLPVRWRFKSRVQQITNTVSQPYKFNFPIKNPEEIEFNYIRQIIILHPYVVSTRPVLTKIDGLEDGTFELVVSFMVMNEEYGKQIENTIRSRYLSGNGTIES